MAKLTGPQIGQLQELILDAFNQEQFEELLLVKLDVRLDQIVPAGLDWRAAAREALVTAEREGWTANLLHAVAEARPRRKDIQDLTAQLLPLVEHAAPTMAPVDRPAPALPPFVPQPAPTATSKVWRWLLPLAALLALGVVLGFLLRGGATWVDVPAGWFLMGSADSDDEAQRHEKPQHTVYLNAFQIMRTEVTNAMYAECVEAGACEPPSSKESSTRTSYYGNPQFANHPVIYISWTDAHAYCSWIKGRLPTEAEWEKAARGIDGHIYPWGDEPRSAQLANFGKNVNDTTPVGAYSAGASPYRALDMAGNVWEWVSDRYDRAYYASSPGRNPPGPATGNERVLRGGSFMSDAETVRAASRFDRPPDSGFPNAGFRCVRSP